MQIFAGVPQMRVWSLKMAIFAYFVHCPSNILIIIIIIIIII